ncbi:MAG: CvpA family protein [Sedimentisphaerales bacterium]|nr:CvpA family protein [Sedimentisphaerales bacterium]
MLGELIVFITILIVVAFVYVKGAIIKASLLLISTLAATAVTFGFFENLAKLIISHGFIISIALPVSFILLFAATMIILNILIGKLVTAELSYNKMTDNIVKCLIASFTGFIIAGIILIAASMMPLGKLPYQRFTKNVTNSIKPDKKLILNADGFVTGLFSWLSRGSMSSNKSFATLHPDFINEIHLNKLGWDKDNKPYTGAEAVSVKAAWKPEAELVSLSDNQPINTSGKKAIIVRVLISLNTIQEGGARPDREIMAFTLAQVGLVCKDSDSANNLGGKGIIIRPIGYLNGENIVEEKNLTERIESKELDIVFLIPPDTAPVVLKFKQNGAASIQKLVSGEKIPPPL